MAVAASASMGNSAVIARSVVVAASASMGGSAVCVRSVAVAASASMGGGAPPAKKKYVCATRRIVAAWQLPFSQHTAEHSLA